MGAHRCCWLTHCGASNSRTHIYSWLPNAAFQVSSGTNTKPNSVLIFAQHLLSDAVQFLLCPLVAMWCTYGAVYGSMHVHLKLLLLVLLPISWPHLRLHPSSPYKLEDMATDAADLLQALGRKHGIQTSNVCVVGLSMGGMIAQLLAINYPRVVQSAVFVMTTAKFSCYSP
eukprot:SAG31_NODE_4265_length_3394_cov_1.455842_3_plen_171_part_00